MKPRGIYKVNNVFVKSVYNCVAEHIVCSDIVAEYYLISAIEDCLRANTKERRLTMLENMVLMGIFRPKRDEVPGEWRELHNEVLNNLYCSPNIIRVIKSRRMKLAGYVERMGDRRGAYRVLVGKPEGRRPLEGARCRWEYNINIDPQEVG
jgi:hypothetical protein